MSLFSICSYLPTTPGVGGEVLHFELQKGFFPDCVRTCRNVPPVSLPSPFSHKPPSFPLASTTTPLPSFKHCLYHLCLYIPRSNNYPASKPGEKVTRRGRMCSCAFTRIEGSCRYVFARSFELYCNYADTTAGAKQGFVIIPPGNRKSTA